MRTSLVVIDQEPMCRLTHLIEIVKHVQIEYRVTEGAVVALDEGVLVRFAGLDVANIDAVFGTLGDKALRKKLRPVVAANCARIAAPSGNVVEHPNHSLRTDRCIDFDRKPLARKVIDNVERTEASAVIKRVVHKVDRPEWSGLGAA